MSDTAHERRVGYVAECFWPGVSQAELEAAEMRASAGAAAVSSKGDAVRYLGSLLFPADEIVFFQFHSTSAEAVRRASERAQLPFERIVELTASHQRQSGGDPGLAR